jgi:hypothetical protein
MNSAKLSVVCRCGHARRMHRNGLIFEDYPSACREVHTGPKTWNEYRDGCYYFEAAEGWQESFAGALRSEGYLVERVQRDSFGRFVRRAAAS